MYNMLSFQGCILVFGMIIFLGTKFGAWDWAWYPFGTDMGLVLVFRIGYCLDHCIICAAGRQIGNRGLGIYYDR